MDKPNEAEPVRSAKDDGDELVDTSPSREEEETWTASQQHFSQQAKFTKISIMFSLFMVVFLSNFDTTVVSTALPTIAHDLKASDSGYTWIGSSYLLASSAVTPSWGKVSDIFGRKPILLLASGILFAGSLICALSVSIPMLIGGRVIQGIGGGGLLTLVNICIADLVTLRSRGLYYGLLGIALGTAAAVGPVIGGVLTQRVTWRWCFYINLPCDGAAFLVLLFFLKLETPHVSLKQGIKDIDWVGTVLIIGSVVMFLFGLEAGGVALPWNSATVISLIVVGAFLAVVFLFWEWTFARVPTVPPSLLKNRSVLAALGVCFCHSFVFIASNYFLPFYFQAVLGDSPLDSALSQLPYVNAIGITAMAVSIYIRKTGRYRLPIWLGMGLMTIGFGIFIAMPAKEDWGRLAPFEVITGLGAGPIFQAPLIALQSHVHSVDMATGTASFGFVRQIAGAIGIVVSGVVFQNKISGARGQLQSLVDTNTTDVILSGIYGSSVEILPHLSNSTREVVSEIYAAGLSSTWIFYTVLSGVGFLVSILMIEKVSPSPIHRGKRETDLEMDTPHGPAEEGRKAEEKLTTYT